MNERLRVLKMVEEGKISAEKAAEILQALESSQDVKPKSQKRKWLRIYIHSRDDNEKVNIKIPFALLKFAKYFMKDVKEDINIEEMLRQIEGGEELVSVESEDEVVKIWVE